MDDVCVWLGSLDLGGGSYEKAFRENAVTGDVLMELNTVELRFGCRRVIVIVFVCWGGVVVSVCDCVRVCVGGGVVVSVCVVGTRVGTCVMCARV